VLIRGDGQVLYTFASVVDDVEMGVTDIVRGADHVTNTATQIQIIEALGGAVPRFAHHSLLTGPQGEALSKRLGTLALRDLRAQGMEPLAIRSLMARLGSADPVELRGSLDEIVAGFDISRFGAAPTKFDAEDLKPLTAHVLAHRSYPQMAAEIAALGVPEAIAPAFWEAVKGNLGTRADLALWWAICRDGAVPVVEEEDRAFVAEALQLWSQGRLGPEAWAAWTGAVKAATGRKGRGLFRPLRLALTGRETGPEMADLLPLLQRRPSL
jgi:glutamyl-tRNA synthetase